MMININPLILFGLFSFCSFSQNNKEVINEINLETIKENSINYYWLKLTEDGFNNDLKVPLIILKGKHNSPVIGLTAAIHGNELNGIPIIQQLVQEIDVSKLQGTIIAIPGLNAVSIPKHTRRFIDEQDLNRNFSGKENGNRSQQYVWNIKEKILRKLDYLVDMHTASFGRTNSLYVRADMNDSVISKMANTLDADIILNSKGYNHAVTKNHTMRAEAVLNGTPAITVEYGNPQVYQQEITKRGVNGLLNLLDTFKIYENQDSQSFKKPVQCKRSYWVFTDKGGYLEVKVELKQIVEKGKLLAVLKNPFGEVVKEYFSPEKAIVIGKSTNPVNMSGGRIVHLGIIKESE